MHSLTDHTAACHMISYWNEMSSVRPSVTMCSGCSRKNCTKFTNHSFAAIRHRVMQFQQNAEKEIVCMTKTSA